MRLELLNDLALKEEGNSRADGLEFTKYATVLANAALETPGPFTIGIFGEWGVGKTSLMRIVQAELSKWFKLTDASLRKLKKQGISEEVLKSLKKLVGQDFLSTHGFLEALTQQLGKDTLKGVEKYILQHAVISQKPTASKRKSALQHKEVRTVWFNAWRFEKEEHPIVPLIATIIQQLERQKGGSENIQKHIDSVIRSLRAVAYGFSAKAKVKFPGIAEVEAGFVAKDMLAREKELTRDPLLDRSLYYNAFQTLAEVQKDIKDDVKIVIFIDDLDRCLPPQAIQLLESIKLILAQPGFIFFLGLARSVVEGYLQHRYANDYGIQNFEGHEYLDKIVQLPFVIPSHQGRMEEFSESLFDKLQEDKDLFRDIIQIIGPACKNNPRATIRFVNNLLVDQRIYSLIDFDRDIPLGCFAIARGLQQSWKHIYKILATAPQELCQKIADWKLSFPNIEVDGSNDDEVFIARELKNVENFRSLFHSKFGLEWLQEPKIRQATIDYLQIRSDSLDSRELRDLLCIYSPSAKADVQRVTNILTNHGISTIDLDISNPITKSLPELKAFIFFIDSTWKENSTDWSKTALEIILKAQTRIEISTVIFQSVSPEDIPPFLRSRPGIELQPTEINEKILKPFIQQLHDSLFP